MRTIVRLWIWRVAALVTFCFPLPLAAQGVIWDMDDENAWEVVQDADADAQFGVDYSVYGIPEAPNGGDTLGIRVAANIVAPGDDAAITLSPAGLSLAGEYRVQVDVWLNFYADLDFSGTTEFAGVFVGFDPGSDPVNGVGLIGSTDGDAVADYQLYAGDPAVQLTIGEYPSLYYIETQDNSDPLLVEALPPQETPIEQTEEFDPPNEYTTTREGALGFAWHTFAVDVSDAGTLAVFSIDDLEIAEYNLEDVSLEGGIGLTLWDIFTSVSPGPDFAFTIFDNLIIEMDDIAVLGDFNNDGLLTLADINLLSDAVRTGDQDSQFDVDGNGDVDAADHTYWVKTLFPTWFGDANLDGEFNSSDFVQTFQNGEYEDGLPLNSEWQDGDWNFDGEFDTSDFVKAFQDGGFEQGPAAAVSAVPEPSSISLALIGAIGLVHGIRRRN